VADELDSIVVAVGRAQADWSAPVARFDRTRALLDAIGWNERDPEPDLEVELEQHRQAMEESLSAQLDSELYLASQSGPAAGKQRRRAGAYAATIQAFAEGAGLDLGGR
jgi:hypothetical protein